MKNEIALPPAEARIAAAFFTLASVGRHYDRPASSLRMEPSPHLAYSSVTSRAALGSCCYLGHSSAGGGAPAARLTPVARDVRGTDAQDSR